MKGKGQVALRSGFRVVLMSPSCERRHSNTHEMKSRISESLPADRRNFASHLCH